MELKTKKGTILPLTNLKGKQYLMVAYRLQWLTEDCESYSIDTSFPVMQKDETVANAVVKIYDKDGKVVKQASATKREDVKGFADHLEKAETGAIGRALAMLGFGTQHALSDLDEGLRLADSPLDPVKQQASVQLKPEQTTEVKSVKPTFAKPKVEVKSAESAWQ